MKYLTASLPFDAEINYIAAGMPLLLGQMEKAGIKTRGIDFNAELYNKFFDKEYAADGLRKIEELYRKQLNKGSWNKEEEKALKRYEAVIRNKKYYEELIKQLDEIKEAVRTKKADKSRESAGILRLIYTPYAEYAPWKHFNSSYNYEEIKKFASDKENNIFYNFLLKYGEDYKFKEYAAIGITLPLLDSIYYAFTLGRYIKETAPNVKIIFGGPVVTRIWDEFAKFPEIFELYCDNMLEGDGDRAILRYIEYAEGKIGAVDVPGLLYKDKKGGIAHNEGDNADIRAIEPPSYKNIDLTKYPQDTCIALQFSRGCTWNKCSFCVQSFPHSRKYSIMEAEKAADIIEDIVKKSGFHSFHIVDDHVPLGFLAKFAKEIIKRELKIEYHIFSRFEDYYTQEIFDLIAKSGCSRIFWGYEAASERVLGLMNKGIIKKDRNEILRMSKKAGIINQLGIMAGFPGETEEEAQQTINFILKNFTRTFDWFQLHTLALQKNSRLLYNTEKFGIKNIKKTSDFNIDYSYEISSVPLCRINEMRSMCFAEIAKKKTDETEKIERFHNFCWVKKKIAENQLKTFK